MNKKTWNKVRYWRRKYNSTPNGWAVAQLIGQEYENESSRTSSATRKKRR